jgi:predicted site-specific integrase-resolvase
VQTRKIQRWYSKNQVAARYGVSSRSIERWSERGKFPPGVQMPNGHWYRTDVQIEDHERSLVGGRQLPESTEPALVVPAG